MQNIDFWASTHQGLARTNNEDAYLWLTPEDTGGNGHLWVVCDGMGGEAGGERASRIVLERFKEVYGATLQQTASPHKALEETLQAANRRLLYLAKEEPDFAGMGSTVAAVALYKDRLWVASVGDSRVYGWTTGGLLQWTVDHSKYEKMRSMGVLRPEDERADHPARHVLMNVVGRSQMFVDTLDGRHFSPKECALLLCSDGLSGNVRPEELRAAFASLDAQDATRFLLSAALPRSGDNITLQVVRFTPPITPRSLADVAASFGVKLIDPHSDANLHESGQSVQHPLGDQAPARPPASSKPSADSMPVTTHKGETVLLSPDALSNVFGDAPSSELETTEGVEKRVASAGGTVMLSPDALSDAMKAHGISPDEASASSDSGDVDSGERTEPYAPESDAAAEPSTRGSSSADDDEKNVTTAGGTVMLSPDAISDALKAHGISSTTPPEDQTPSTTAARADGTPPLGAKVYSAPIDTLDGPSDHSASAADAASDDPASSAKAARADARKNLAASITDAPRADIDAAPVDDARYDETPPKRRVLFGVIGICFLFILGVALLLWKSGASTPAESIERVKEELGLDTAPDAVTPRILPAYVQAEKQGAPDRVHARDEMPAYAVLDSAMLIDAHEVTAAQFTRVRDSLTSRGGDIESLKALPCLGQDRVGEKESHDPDRQPVCVTPLAAAAYCAAVDRRLPHEEEWQEIVSSEQARIAPGYGTIFERAADGPPPAIPTPVTSIVGVYDGLPELLYTNAAQIEHGDLILLAPAKDASLIRKDPGAMADYESKDTPSEHMLGVRCIAENTPEDDGVLGAPKTQRTRAPREKSPAKTTKTPPKEATDRMIQPRVEAPDEAPIDPNIPDRSRILEYMKETQER